MTTPQEGEIWKINHSRKGNLTVRVIKDMSEKPGDEWVELEIIDGKVKYLSAGNNIAQMECGLGTKGDTITVRKSFVTWIEKETGEATP